MTIQLPSYLLHASTKKTMCSYFLSFNLQQERQTKKKKTLSHPNPLSSPYLALPPPCSRYVH